MDCEICRRPYDSQKLPFLCAVDARNRCYEGRIRNLQMLVENDDLQRQVNELLSNAASGSVPVTKASLVSSVSQQRVAEDRTSQVIAQAEKLRAEIADARQEIESRKATIARRKSDLASASNGIAARRARHQEEAEKSIKMQKYKWNRSADGMAATRSFLCMEAAKLYGLRRIKKGASPLRYEYRLGGFEVVDLGSMNTLTPDVISTSLAHIAHILVLASHYLAIRLPAEITLPHRDYPRPTVFNLSSSYQHGDVPFPGATAIPNFGAETRDREAYVPRPRPLYVDKQLQVLAKEDPSTYAFLLEGVTLLAYDIAWACSTQGVPIGDKTSFEDVCHMGRNLYNLLIGHQLHNAQSAKMYPMISSNNNSNTDQDEIGKQVSQVGRYSHGTAHSYLGSAEGSELIRSFKLPSPMKLADRLKKKLASDVTIPEWEVLEDDAWILDDDEAVLVGNQKQKNSDRRLSGAESAATSEGYRSPSGAGTSGWTKLKSR